jgi:hypothetical protein
MYSYIVGRRELPNTYQYVGLRLMLTLAKAAQCGMLFASPNQDEQRNIKCYLVPGTPLHAVQTQLVSFTLAHFGQPTSLRAPLPEATYHWLRQHYLHLSWSDRLGFEFRRDAHGSPTRKIIVG